MDFKVGEYIVYVNGDRYELGRIKSITEDGAFVVYHEGETGAKTSFDLMHKIANGIKETALGGDFFNDNVIYVETWEVEENSERYLIDISYTRSMCPTFELRDKFRLAQADIHNCILRRLLQTRRI